MEALLSILFFVGILGAVVYYGCTEKGRAAAEKARADQEQRKQDREKQKADQARRELASKPGGKVHAPLSEVGSRSPDGSGLACPKCGGMQFRARRSGAARAGIVGTTVATGGIGGIVAAGVTKQKRVTCVTCGTVYLRG